MDTEPISLTLVSEIDGSKLEAGFHEGVPCLRLVISKEEWQRRGAAPNGLDLLLRLGDHSHSKLLAALRNGRSEIKL